MDPHHLHSFTREPVVAGRFYSSSPGRLHEEINSLFHGITPLPMAAKPLALVVPHAGYVFSGFTAAKAYIQLDSYESFNTVFLVGASHYVSFECASVFVGSYFKTPLGLVSVDEETSLSLLDSSPLFCRCNEAHNQEHGLEVQLPFLQLRLHKPFRVVAILIGSKRPDFCKDLAQLLKPYFNSENLFVISSDLSHYPRYADALVSDRLTCRSIESNKPELFLSAMDENSRRGYEGQVTSACGWTALLTLLYITSDHPSVQYTHLHYTNSGENEMHGDKSRVVGYCAFAVSLAEGTSANTAKTEDASWPDQTSRKNLLQIARMTLENLIRSGKTFSIPAEWITGDLQVQAGLFVSLYKSGSLRGCVGRFESGEPLYKLARSITISAATADRRFEPVTVEELGEIHIELSILTPLKKISQPGDFTPGKQGIYIRKGNRSGTYLPQVAVKTGWNREELLGHCARDKAGIGWEGWKEAELFTYEALVIQ